MFTTIIQTLRINQFGQVYSIECQAEHLETNDKTKNFFFGSDYTPEFLEFSEQIFPIFSDQRKMVKSILKRIERRNFIPLKINSNNRPGFKKFTLYFRDLLATFKEFTLTAINLYTAVTGITPRGLTFIVYEIMYRIAGTLSELSLSESFKALDAFPVPCGYFHRIFSNLKEIIDNVITLKKFFQTDYRFLTLKKYECILKQLNTTSIVAMGMIETIQKSFIQLTSINMETCCVSDIIVNLCVDGSLETKKPRLYSSKLMEQTTTTEVLSLMNKQTDLKISNISNNKVADKSVAKRLVPFITDRFDKNSKLTDIKTQFNSTRGIEEPAMTSTSIFDRIRNSFHNFFRKAH